MFKTSRVENINSPNLGKSWRVRDVFYAIILYFIIYEVFLFIETIIFGKGVLGNTSPNGWLVFVEDIADAFILSAIPIFYVIKFYNANLEDVGINLHDARKHLLKGVLFGILLWVLASICDMGITSIWGASPKHPYLQKLATSRGDTILYIALLISISILAPISEEIYFRGFSYTIFKKRYGRTVGLILSSLLFSVVHLSLWQATQIFIVGFGLAVLFENTHSLVSVITAHASINLLSVYVGNI